MKGCSTDENWDIIYDFDLEENCPQPADEK